MYHRPSAMVTATITGVATPVESVAACRREIAELPSEVRTVS
jgi:hypothetical protein